MKDAGEHLVKKSDKSKMVTREALVELTWNDPITFFILDDKNQFLLYYEFVQPIIQI